MTGTELKQRRERLGLTQTALAQLWQVRQATISEWENEKKGMEHPKIIEMALQTLERKQRSKKRA